MSFALLCCASLCLLCMCNHASLDYAGGEGMPDMGGAGGMPDMGGAGAGGAGPNIEEVD